MEDRAILAERAVLAIERIADELGRLREMWATPSEPVPEPCPHPTDQRIDFGVTDGREDWRCKACGYSSLSEAA